MNELQINEMIENFFGWLDNDCPNLFFNQWLELSTGEKNEVLRIIRSDYDRLTYLEFTSALGVGYMLIEADKNIKEISEELFPA